MPAKAKAMKAQVPKKIMAPASKKAGKSIGAVANAAPKKMSWAELLQSKVRADVDCVGLEDPNEDRSERNVKENERRDDDAAAERAIMRKFPALTLQKMNRLRNKEDNTPQDVVREEIRRRRKFNKYLDQDFWCNFIEMFDLQGHSCFDMLAEPTENESVHKDLVAAILKTRSKNPAQRTTEDLRSYLEYCDEPNKTELYGILSACAPCIQLNSGHRTEIEEMSLEVIGKFGLAEKYEDYWKIVAESMEGTLEEKWLEESCMGRPAFVTNNAHTLALFMDKIALESVENALANKNEPDVSFLRACVRTRLGAALYKDQAMRLQWVVFLENITSGIRDLFHADFQEAEYRAFETKMKREASLVVTSGTRTFDQKEMKLRFLSLESMQCKALHINDHWCFPAESEMKGLALRLGKLVYLPHEKLLYGDSPIEGVAAGIDVPTALIANFQKVRTSAINMLGDGPHTIKEIKAKLTTTAAFKMLTKINRSWIVEHTFLVDHAERLLEEKVQNGVLASFEKPGADGKAPFDKVIVAIGVAKASPEVAALPLPFTKALNSMKGMIQDLAKGVSPPEKELKCFSKFHLAALDRAQDWCMCSEIEEIEGCPGVRSKKTFYGKVAVQKKFTSLEADVQNGRTPGSDELKELHRFSWLLSAEQHANLNDWVKQGVRNYRLTLCPMIDDAPDRKNVKLDAKGEKVECLSQASSDQVVMYQADKSQKKLTRPAPAPRKKAGGDKINEDEADAMASLFGKKARTGQ